MSNRRHTLVHMYIPTYMRANQTKRKDAPFFFYKEKSVAFFSVRDDISKEKREKTLERERERRTNEGRKRERMNEEKERT